MKRVTALHRLVQPGRILRATRYKPSRGAERDPARQRGRRPIHRSLSSPLCPPRPSVSWLSRSVCSALGFGRARRFASRRSSAGSRSTPLSRGAGSAVGRRATGNDAGSGSRPDRRAPPRLPSNPLPPLRGTVDLRFRLPASAGVRSPPRPGSTSPECPTPRHAKKLSRFRSDGAASTGMIRRRFGQMLSSSFTPRDAFAAFIGYTWVFWREPGRRPLGSTDEFPAASCSKNTHFGRKDRQAWQGSCTRKTRRGPDLQDDRVGRKKKKQNRRKNCY